MFGAYASSFVESAPPSVTKYYGFPNTPFGTVGQYTDGVPRIRLGTWFYTKHRHSSSPAMRSSNYEGSSNIQAWDSLGFNPPAGSVLIVTSHAVQSYNNAWSSPTITDNIGLTWHLVATQGDTSDLLSSSQTALFWAYCPTAQTGLVVTTTHSCAVGQTITFSSIDVDVWLGLSSTAPIGNTVQGYYTGTDLAVAITPANSESALMISASNAGASSTAATAGSGESVVQQTTIGPNFVRAWYGSASSPQLATAQTLDLSNAAGSRWQYIAYEVNDAVPNVQCIGGRVYIADSSAIGKTLRIRGLLRTDGTRPNDVGNLAFNFDNTPGGSVDVVVSATGWVEGNWTGFNFTDGQSVFIFYEFIDSPGWYEFMAGVNFPSVDAIPAPTLAGLYIAEDSFSRNYFTQDASGIPTQAFNGAWYGADIVVSA